MIGFIPFLGPLNIAPLNIIDDWNHRFWNHRLLNHRWFQRSKNFYNNRWSIYTFDHRWFIDYSLIIGKINDDNILRTKTHYICWSALIFDDHRFVFSQKLWSILINVDHEFRWSSMSQVLSTPFMMINIRSSMSQRWSILILKKL